ncbi:type IV toxin-antitoxin system AbiEi family antitoxin domain-containing protein [Nocardia sp. NPDC049220]|uniref:type IV toxin-antitoxin system AbiEi family antitoxin domain-containing protein n=1 Tax=Nocardia sp. NPDC049220 TaxID=3155273 RepID=UPI00340E58EA
MAREELLLELADLAGVQWGLFTSAQAVELGFTAQQLKRLADSELITRLRQGVYRLTGTPQSPADPVRAEWLALEPKRLAGERLADEAPVGVVSHRSAARLQELGDIDADIHEFTVPQRRSTRSHDVKFRIRELTRRDWHLVEGLPVTRPLRTVLDLAADGIDGGHLATIVRDAILTGDVTRDELATALRPFAHRYGMPIGAGSALVHNFIGQAGVPEATRSLTRDISFPFADLTAAVAQQAGGPSKAEAKLLDLLLNQHTGTAAAAVWEQWTEDFRKRHAAALNLIPTSPALDATLFNSIKSPATDPLPSMAAFVKWSALSSKLFENFSEAALNAESTRDSHVRTTPRSAAAEKASEGDREGDKGSDAEIPDRRRISKSDQ